MRHRSPRLIHLLGAALVLAAPSSTLFRPLLAQSAALGAIAGVVRDGAGAIIPGATVTITNTGTGAKRSLVTDSEGHYEATFLQPGRYEVVLSGGTNFGTVDQKNIPVTVGAATSVNATLPAATVTTEVQVTADQPVLDTEKVEQSQVIDQQLVSNLPVNGRRFDNFVLLTPNVAPDGNSGLISYRGISGLYNTNLVDGANNNQAFFSEARGRSVGAPYVYPVDAIQEFESSATGYSAELGGAAGGIINAITKSGSNQVHGDAYEYYRTPGFNALDAYNKYQGKLTGNPVYLQQPVKVQHQFGLSIGGPILKDKLFYHFTYDGFRKVNPIVYTSTYNGTATSVANLVNLCNGGTAHVVDAGITYPTTIPNITAGNCQQAVAFLQSQDGSFGRNVYQNIFFPRLDYQLTPKTHLSASYLWEDFQQPNGYNSSVTVSNGGISQNGEANFHERFLVANAETAVSSNATNVIHFQESRDLETDGTNTGGPATSLTNLASFGETAALPRGAFPDEHRWQFTDIYSLVHGQHSLKFGVDMNLIHEQIANLFGGDGSFSYSNSSVEQNFANWVQDTFGVNPTASSTAGAPRAVRHYNSFSQTVDQLTGVGADDFWNQDIDGFAEDAWKVTPRLLLSVGARYDVQLVPAPNLPYPATAAQAAGYPAGALPLQPSPVAYNATSQINPDLKLIQPRIGFAWNPQPGTVVRGGYGIFYGLISNSAYYTERRENGVYQKQYGPINASVANVPYLVNTARGTATYQNIGSYVSYSPVGGVPIATPPGPAPVNLVTGAGLTPAGLAAVPTGTITIRGLDPSFRNAQSHSADLSVEQLLPFKTTLSVGYVGNRGLRLPVYVDTNVDPTSVKNNLTYRYTSRQGQVTNFSVPVYTNKLNSTVGTVATGFSDVNSWYNSFVASVRKPFSNGVEVLANYTWAHSLDDGQSSGVNGTFNGTDAPLIPFALGPKQGRGAEYSRSDLDQRGRFVGTLLARSKTPITNRYVKYLTDGWELSGTYTAQTGFPLTGFVSGAVSYVNSGRFSSGGVNSPIALTDGGVTNAVFTSGTGSRVPNQIATRNAFKGPGIHNLDARVAREFPLHYEGMRIEVAAEAFNVANHRNILAVNTSYATYTAPTATSAACPTNAANTNIGCFTPYASGSSTFGTPTATSGVLYGERQLQLVGRFFF